MTAPHTPHSTGRVSPTNCNASTARPHAAPTQAPSKIRVTNKVPGQTHGRHTRAQACHVGYRAPPRMCGEGTQHAAAHAISMPCSGMPCRPHPQPPPHLQLPATGPHGRCPPRSVWLPERGDTMHANARCSTCLHRYFVSFRDPCAAVRGPLQAGQGAGDAHLPLNGCIGHAWAPRAQMAEAVATCGPLWWHLGHNLMIFKLP